MVCFDYKRGIRIREMAFGSVIDSVQQRCDVVYMHSNDQLNLSGSIKKKCIAHEQFTLINNLAQDESEIFNSFNKNYKNEIRRAIKEDVKCYIVDSQTSIQEEILEFESVYNNMFEAKGLDNRFNRTLVEAGLAKKQIIITKAVTDEKDCVVFHAYLADGNKTMLMYSASTLAETQSKEISNLIGWMNKYLHWFDIQWFRNNGYTTFEWGGINSIDEPNGIARFKMGFGGQTIKYINYLTAASFLGRVYIFMVKRKERKWK